MATLCVRAVDEADVVAMGDFDHNNRETFETFNEPRSDAHYSHAGISKSLRLVMADERAGKLLTRVVVAQNEAQWLGKGCLTFHDKGGEVVALMAYQTDQRHWRRGVATALIKELLSEADERGVSRVFACVAFDNLVSLHLLRRAGFRVSGWAEPARLRRGTLDCLELCRPSIAANGACLLRPNMQLPA